MRFTDWLKQYQHTIVLVVVTLAAGGLLLDLVQPRPQYDDRNYRTTGLKLAQRISRLVGDSTALHDSLKVVEAVRTRGTIRYVTDRRAATDAVEALPAAKLVDTATYVAQLEKTVSAQDVALRSADALVRADTVVIQTMQHTIDTFRELAVTNDSTAQNEKQRGDDLAKELSPGLLARLKSGVFAVVKDAGVAAVGFGLGVLAAKVVF